MGVLMEEVDYLKCRKHPSKHRPVGVCALCLRDRLLRLCPDCANVRPCACCPTTTSSSSSSSTTTTTTTSFSFSSPRSCSGSGLGSIGRISNLIDDEPAFQRSRSSIVSRLRNKDRTLLPPSGNRSGKLASIWSVFKKQKEAEKEEEEEDATKMMRSNSVGIVCGETDTGRVEKGRSWYFQSPIKVFRQTKVGSRVVQERSPLCRG